MTEPDPILDYLDRKPPSERAKIKAALLAVRDLDVLDMDEVLDLVEEILAAEDETRRRRARRRRKDNAKRTLVGARVPRAFYERCRRDAEARGMSLYAWTVSALERALERPWW